MKLFTIAALACGLALSHPAAAQDRSYDPGTVWNFSHIDVADGQFENYLDYLKKEFKARNEFGKREGEVVSYHVFAVNNARAGEPDLILATEYKDYVPTARQEELSKKFLAQMQQTERQSEEARGGRKPMRTVMGSMQLQELKLK